MQAEVDTTTRDGSEAFAALLASLSDLGNKTDSAKKILAAKAIHSASIVSPEGDVTIDESAGESPKDPEAEDVEITSEGANNDTVKRSKVEPDVNMKEEPSDEPEEEIPEEKYKEKPSFKDDEDDEDYEEGEEGEETEDELKNRDKQEETENDPTHSIIAGPKDEHSGEKRKRRTDDDWRPGSNKKRFKGRRSLSSTPSPTHPSRAPGSPTSFSPTKRSPQTLDNKLSFQEAAVRVLTEQRQKGNYALSTRKIWELIQQAGLVDTKCKTPVSSLSSRITEDVRTKGNKSVFVRVGEGLYTLRKGLKKSELEKYLSTKYPHMAHNLDGDSKISDENDFEEEIEEEKEIKVEKEEKKESVRENLREKEPRFPTHTEPSWVGLPLKTKTNGDLYYSAVRVDKHRFKIGDCAFFTPNSDDQSPYIGQITKLWQSKTKRNGGTSNVPTEQMLVQCVWYYYPEDTHTGRTKKHHKHELFLSDLSDVNTVDNLLSPAEVLSFQEYNKKVNSTPKKDLKDLFFCRYFYSENTKEFHPLKLDYSNGHYNIEGFQREKPILQPKNWPQGLEYTQNCMWRNMPEMIKDYLQLKTSPIAELRQVQADGQDQKFSLFALKELKQGAIVGEFTGYLCVSGDNVEDNGTEPKFMRILYEDEEISVSVDASNSGNEYRFINDSNLKGRPANVGYLPVQLDGKWHLIIVALVDIKVDEELLVDTKFKYWGQSSAMTIQESSSTV